MVYHGKSETEMDDLGVPPMTLETSISRNGWTNYGCYIASWDPWDYSPSPSFIYMYKYTTWGSPVMFVGL